MATLDRHIKTFAESVQDAFDADLKYRLSGSRSESAAASLHMVLRRTKYLALALRNKSGVQMAAAQLGASLVAVWLIGDGTEEGAQMPLPLVSVPNEDGEAVDLITASDLDRAAQEQEIDVTLPELAGENPPPSRDKEEEERVVADARGTSRRRKAEFGTHA